MNQRKKALNRAKKISHLKIFERILSDAICFDTTITPGIDQETLASCFLEELASRTEDQIEKEWRDIVTDVILDIGGLSSDTSDEVVQDVEKVGGFKFVLGMFEDESRRSENGSLQEGMLCKAIESITNEWMDGRIIKLVEANCENSIDNDEKSGEQPQKHAIVNFFKYNKSEIVKFSNINVSSENRWDDAGEGQCEMCLRIIPLTRHHLIPRTVHQKFKSKQKKLSTKKGRSKVGSFDVPLSYTREELNKCISICRPCHSAVHKAENEITLATKYNTLDLLKEHPQIKKFILYISNQKKLGKHNSDNRLVNPSAKHRRSRRRKV